MGLDMHIYKTKKLPKNGKTNSRDTPHVDEEYFQDLKWHEIPDWIKEDYYDPSDDIELHYWRKHWALHRWFEQLYRKHNGNDYAKHTEAYDKLDLFYEQRIQDNLAYLDRETFDHIIEMELEDERWGEIEDEEPDFVIYFNGQSIELEISDIVQVQYALETQTLPSLAEDEEYHITKPYTEDRIKDDREFIKKAKDALRDGWHLYYFSTW